MRSAQFTPLQASNRVYYITQANTGKVTLPNVFFSLKYGRAPIHWASSRGSLDVMDMLIKAKCDVEAQDRYGMRALLMAAWHGHRDAVEMLINAGASVLAVNKVLSHKTFLA